MIYSRLSTEEKEFLRTESQDCDAVDNTRRRGEPGVSEGKTDSTAAVKLVRLEGLRAMLLRLELTEDRRSSCSDITLHSSLGGLVRLIESGSASSCGDDSVGGCLVKDRA
jgi:hypothetical protein